MRSYAWFELGRRGGAPIPEQDVDKLRGLLSDDQRAEAGRLIEDWGDASEGATAGS